MQELKKQIKAKLTAIHPNVTVDGVIKSRVHHEEAPDDSSLPYVVFNFPNSFTNENQEVFSMDIDIWDMPTNGSTSAIDTLNDLIWKQLHKYRYIDDNIQISIYRSSRGSVEEEDKRIKRRRLIFNVKYFDRR